MEEEEMRKTAVVWAVAGILCVAVAGGCYDRITKKDLSDDESRIDLRARVLDISSSHLEGYGDEVHDIDEFVLAEEAKNLLENIFVEVSTDASYPHSEIDVTIHLRTKREDALGKAIAEIVVRKGYQRQILVRESFRGRYQGLAHDTNDTIRNRASFRAMKAAIQSLRQDQAIAAYAQELAEKESNDRDEASAEDAARDAQ